MELNADVRLKHGERQEKEKPWRERERERKREREREREGERGGRERRLDAQRQYVVIGTLALPVV